jgi:hypothetical protein
MGIALPCKLLSIGCCLFVVSGLTAQPIVPQPGGPGKDQAPQVGDVGPPMLTAEQVGQIMNQVQLEQEAKLRETQRDSAASLQWIRWIAYALVAAGGVWGSWGAKQALTRRSPPKPRVERLGLGADGTGGVWLREVFPWEE